MIDIWELSCFFFPPSFSVVVIPSFILSLLCASHSLPFPSGQAWNLRITRVCVSAGRKMRRKRRDKEGSWKVGEWKGDEEEEGGWEHVCTWRVRRNKGEKSGEEGEEPQGLLFFFQWEEIFLTFIFSLHSLSPSCAATTKFSLFTHTHSSERTSLWQSSVFSDSPFRLQSGNSTPDTPLTVRVPHTPSQGSQVN